MYYFLFFFFVSFLFGVSLYLYFFLGANGLFSLYFRIIFIGCLDFIFMFRVKLFLVRVWFLDWGVVFKFWLRKNGKKWLV